MVHVLPHWNWESAGHETIPVMAYTNCEEVELFVNGKSLGRKVKGKDLTRIPVKFNKYQSDHLLSKYRLSWDAKWAPGSLKVVGYIDGKAVAEKEIKTAGGAAKIRLIPDRNKIKASQNDLSYVTVRIEDADGNLCPVAMNKVNFSVVGAGSIAAVGNGNASTTAPFFANHRKAFNGLCMLIVEGGKDTGTIEVTATADGLQAAKTSISVE
jgi:beta-galactosidase